MLAISQLCDNFCQIFTENNYPCKHYQLLTEETRIASYKRKVNDHCDRYFDKWYRFWGEAGNRMLEKCPRVDNQLVFYCGAYYHGWLNATNPVPLDGTVNRTMCFSDITTCNCKQSIAKTIQMRNCGSYFVYKLYDLGDICRRDLANNARYCGMRGKFIFCLLAIVQLGFWSKRGSGWGDVAL